MYTAIAVIIVFGLLVFFHELGHFTVAKLVGIRVYEFSIGFGPKLISFRKGETRYNLRALPLGGFVRMAGMDDDEDLHEIKKLAAEERRIDVKEISDEESERLKETIDDNRSFKNKPVWQRMAVIFAGSFNNFVLGFALLLLMFFLVGVPVGQIPVVDRVIQDSAAQRAHLLPGDRLTAINGAPIKEWSELSDKVNKSKGSTIDLQFKRNGQTKNVLVKPQLKEGRYVIGIYAKTVYQTQSFSKSVSSAAQSFKQVFTQITQVLGGLFVNKESVKNLSGPVGIVVGIKQAYEMGLMYYIFFTAVISINLGIFNLLPIPALDGSRLVFLLIEKLRGRPVDPNKENMVHLVGFALLLLLIVVLSYRDFFRLPNLGG